MVVVFEIVCFGNVDGDRGDDMVFVIWRWGLRWYYCCSDFGGSLGSERWYFVEMGEEFRGGFWEGGVWVRGGLR